MAMRLILISLVASSMFFFMRPIESVDILPPILSPLLNQVCDVVDCGKGRCKAAPNRTVPFTCECDDNWKQFKIEDSFRFMPCVIPNCSLNYSCNNASTPAAAPPPPPPADNSTIVDPCALAYCGEGTCVKTSTFGHKCECADGYANLLNTTRFPCFSECSLGLNCVNLGIGLGNRSSPPSLPDTNPATNKAPSLLDSNPAANNGCSDVSKRLLWLIILVISLAMAL